MLIRIGEARLCGRNEKSMNNRPDAVILYVIPLCFMSLTDPAIDRFLASMTKASRKEFVLRSIIDLPTLTIGIVLSFPGLFAIPIGGFVCKLLGLTAMWQVVVAVIWMLGWSYLFVLMFFRYQKWRLRRHLNAIIVDEMIPHCPNCSTLQTGNESNTCACGCIVRPFAG